MEREQSSRARVDEIISRPGIPPKPSTIGGEKVIPVAQPRHTQAPENADPFYVFGTFSLTAGVTQTTLASILVPDGMVGRVFFIEQQATNFSAGLLDDMIEWQLAYDALGVPPYALFRGTLSLRDFPKRGIVIDPAVGGKVISLRARVLPTAEGGLDLATVNAFGSICGWNEPLEQTP